MWDDNEPDGVPYVPPLMSNPDAAAAAAVNTAVVVAAATATIPNVKFKTGAVRGSKGAIAPAGWPGSDRMFPVRLDLLMQNVVALRRMGERYGEGDIKYPMPEGEIIRNWMKGIPESDLLNHHQHHMMAYMSGDRTEDHLACAVWNLLTLMWVQEKHPELLDTTGRAPVNSLNKRLITTKEELKP